MSDFPNNVLLNEDLIREIQSYTNINSLLNTTKLQIASKKACFQWNLNEETTLLYHEDELFQSTIISKTTDSHRQISLIKYVNIVSSLLSFIFLK